ncbi:LysR family transcriptional regulator [Bordetella genomosp. 8]|nr:LysR family transcriptional regulator [Bordetella genomosp. 8]
MNVKQLEIVAQIAKGGSLLRASISLGLAQSIVSRHLTQLEQEWGSRLFERTGRGMVLTEFGQQLLPQIESFLQSAYQLDNAVKAASVVPTGVVKIGVVPSLANIMVPRLIDDLKAHTPGIRLSFVEGLSGLLDDLLSSGRVDLAIINRYGADSPSSEDLLGEVETYLVCDPRHKFAARQTIQFSELSGLPLILPSAGSGLRRILDQLGKRLEIHINVHMEAESLSVMKKVAASGAAMTLLPVSAVAEEVRDGALSIIKLIQPDIPRRIMLATTQHHGISRAARIVVARLRCLAPELIGRACSVD